MIHYVFLPNSGDGPASFGLVSAVLFTQSPSSMGEKHRLDSKQSGGHFAREFSPLEGWVLVLY